MCRFPVTVDMITRCTNRLCKWMHLRNIPETRPIPRTFRRTVSPLTEFSINARPTETTGDTENACATSGSPNDAPGGLIGVASSMPLDKEEAANRLVDQIFDLQKTLDDLASRMHSIMQVNVAIDAPHWNRLVPKLPPLPSVLNQFSPSEKVILRKPNTQTQT